jgi:hypothetical protein
MSSARNELMGSFSTKPHKLRYPQNLIEIHRDTKGIGTHHGCSSKVTWTAPCVERRLCIYWW